MEILEKRIRHKFVGQKRNEDNKTDYVWHLMKVDIRQKKMGLEARKEGK